MRMLPYGNAVTVDGVPYGAIEGPDYLAADQGVFLIPSDKVAAAQKAGLTLETDLPEDQLHPGG